MISLDKVRVENTAINRDSSPQNDSVIDAEHPKLFLAGPIDWSAIVEAGSLPGHSLHVFIVIMFYVGIKKARIIPLSTKFLRAMGFSRNANYRALQELKKAGLIDYKNNPGRLPIITVLDKVKVWKPGSRVQRSVSAQKAPWI
jgi:hypothetical protein